NRSGPRGGGSERSETADRKLRQAFDLGSLERSLNAELLEEPGSDDVLVIARIDLRQAKLVDQVRRECVGFAHHDLPRIQINKYRVIGRVGQRSRQEV